MYLAVLIRHIKFELLFRALNVGAKRDLKTPIFDIFVKSRTGSVLKINCGMSIKQCWRKWHSFISRFICFWLHCAYSSNKHSGISPKIYNGTFWYLAQTFKNRFASPWSAPPLFIIQTGCFRRFNISIHT